MGWNLHLWWPQCPVGSVLTTPLLDSCVVWRRARPAGKLLLPRCCAVQGGSPGVSSAGGRVDPELAPEFSNQAWGSGTDSSFPEEGLLGTVF